MWWDNGNDLALVEAIRSHVREQDGGFSGEAHTKFFSHLIGAARVAGMTDEQIQDAWCSDRNLTIYEP